MLLYLSTFKLLLPCHQRSKYIHGARHSLILLPTPFHWGSVGAPATSAQTWVKLRSGSHWNRPRALALINENPSSENSLAEILQHLETKITLFS